MRRIRKKHNHINKISSICTHSKCHEFVEKWIHEFENPTDATLPSGIGLTFRHSYKDI